MPVDPRDDLEPVPADLLDAERTGEAIRAERDERRLAPASAAAPVPDDGTNDLVTVADDRRPDGDLVPDARLRRPPAAVDLRRDLADDDPLGNHYAHTVNSPGMRLTRSLGIQLHPTSLPGGRLGPDAYAFVDWLAAAGASWWQVLPLNPPDAVGSPYSSASAFASWGGLLADPDATVEPSEVRAFCEREAAWIRDWEAFAGAGAVEEQVRFEREWTALRDYARSRGIRIVGDVPIYVARDGCDHRSHPELFLPVDEVVAGAPPDLHTPRRPALGESALRLVGARRDRLPLVDRAHGPRAPRSSTASASTTSAASPATGRFRRSDRDARGGRWSPGPGRALFEAAEAALGPLPVIAEDLGIITPDVDRATEGDGLSGHGRLPLVAPGRARACTASSTTSSSRSSTRRRTTRTPSPARWATSDVWPLLEQCLSSRCGLAVLPVQDVLGLGSEARMNTPGVVGGNWQWRLEEGQLTLGDAERLRAAAVASGRVRAGV